MCRGGCYTALLHQTATPKPNRGSTVDRKRGSKISDKKAKNRYKSMTYNGFAFSLAEWTGLEPATPGVTGRYSNQLNYHSWQAAFRLHFSTQAKCYELGDPTGIRTPVLTVKG